MDESSSRPAPSKRRLGRGDLVANRGQRRARRDCRARTLTSTCGAMTTSRTSSCSVVCSRGDDAEKRHRGARSVAGRVVTKVDDVPRLLAAQTYSRPRASARARSGRRRACAIRRMPCARSARSKPMLLMTVPTIVSPRKLAPRVHRAAEREHDVIAADDRARSRRRRARDPHRRRRRRRSRCRSPPSFCFDRTASCSPRRSVAPHCDVDARAVVVAVDLAHVRAELTQRVGRDRVRRTETAVDDHAQAAQIGLAVVELLVVVPRQILRESRATPTAGSRRARKRSRVRAALRSRPRVRRRA